MKYHENERLEGIEQIKSIFPDGEANPLNWCIFSTSGVHGTYTTLDDIETDMNNGEDVPSLTVLIIMPRIVKMIYGNIEVTKENISYLRKLASSSLQFINESQYGNTTK